MAFIEGLEEQRAALARIKSNLKEINSINEAISNIEKYVSDAVSKKYEIKCEFVFKDESLKRISVPIELDDENDLVITSLKKHKETVAELIRKDSSEYKISLTEQEKNAISSEKHSES